MINWSIGKVSTTVFDGSIREWIYEKHKKIVLRHPLSASINEWNKVITAVACSSGTKDNSQCQEVWKTRNAKGSSESADWDWPNKGIERW